MARVAVLAVVVILVVISRAEGLARALRSDWVMSGADANWDDDDDPGRVIVPGKDVGAPEFNWGYDIADDGSNRSGRNEVDGRVCNEGEDAVEPLALLSSG